MAKVLHCDDVVPGCDAVVRADSEDEILTQAAAHASEAHGLTDLDEATVAAVRDAIREG